MLRTVLFSAALAATAAMALADSGQIAIHDAYARASTPMSRSGAVFMVIDNHGAAPDRLIAARSSAADISELHTHLSDPNGVMRMVKVEDGFEIPAGGSHALARGGDHVMLMGLTAPLTEGGSLSLTLTFEQAGEITVEVPVDLNRSDAAPMQGHGGMDHGAMGHGTPKQGM